MPLTEILNADLTPMEDVNIPLLLAGADSGSVEFAVRNGSDQDLFDVLVVLQVEHPTIPNLFVSQGFPPQDELWGRVRLTGQDNSAAPAQQNLTTAWQPAGAYTALLIPTLLAGGIRFGAIKMRPPSSAQQPLNWRWSLATIELDHARAVPPALTAVRRGVLAHVGDLGHSGIVEGCGVTVSDPPDEEVHVEAGFWLHGGRYRGKVVTDLTLDQEDGAAEELEAGESYYAALSLAAGDVVAKGARAPEPVKPPMPPGNAPLLWVRVHFQAGGTSEIAAADVEGPIIYDRYLAFAGDGLQLLLHAGQAIAGSTWRYHSGVTPLALTSEATNFVWQLAPGTFEVTVDEEPPDSTALLLWEAETDADVVTSLRDRRTYAEETIVLHLRGDLPGAPGEIVSLLVEHEALAIERIVCRLSNNGGGASDATILDLEVDGDTVYVSQATDDHRPSFAFDAAELVDVDGVHELADLRRGYVLSFLSAAHPTGGTPIWAEAYLICRRSF